MVDFLVCGVARKKSDGLTAPQISVEFTYHKRPNNGVSKEIHFIKN